MSPAASAPSARRGSARSPGRRPAGCAGALYGARRGGQGGLSALLSNGNLVEAGDLDGGRHFAVWNDPFPKPATCSPWSPANWTCWRQLRDHERAHRGLAHLFDTGMAPRAAYAMTL